MFLSSCALIAKNKLSKSEGESRSLAGKKEPMYQIVVNDFRKHVMWHSMPVFGVVSKKRQV